MPFDPSRFDPGDSRFGVGPASARSGSFSQYLPGNSSLSAFAGSMQGTFRPPTGSNAKQDQAYADQGEAQNMSQWGSGLGSIATQYGNAAQIGAGGLSAKQSWLHAKDTAKMQQQAAQQDKLFSGINAGISVLGGMKTAGVFGGDKSKSYATYSLPSDSNWSMPNLFS